MINFCLLFLVLMAVRRIMWLISSELMCILEDKIKFIFYTAVAAVMLCGYFCRNKNRKKYACLQQGLCKTMH